MFCIVYILDIIEKCLDAGHRNYASFKSITFLFEMSMTVSEGHLLFSLSFSCELLLMHFLI